MLRQRWQPSIRRGGWAVAGDLDGVAFRVTTARPPDGLFIGRIATGPEREDSALPYRWVMPSPGFWETIYPAGVPPEPEPWRMTDPPHREALNRCRVHHLAPCEGECDDACRLVAMVEAARREPRTADEAAADVAAAELAAAEKAERQAEKNRASVARWQAKQAREAEQLAAAERPAGCLNAICGKPAGCQRKACKGRTAPAASPPAPPATPPPPPPAPSSWQAAPSVEAPGLASVAAASDRTRRNLKLAQRDLFG